MTDIGYALEKLIDVLQLEGHELFRIFTEVQLALAIKNLILVIAMISGIVLGILFGMKFSEWIIQKFDVDDYDSGIVRWLVPIIISMIGFVLFLVVADAIVGIYMYAKYPEYYAATELMRRIGYMI